MIKINLATRKQATLARGGGTGTLSRIGINFDFKVDLKSFHVQSVGKLVGFAVVLLMILTGINQYKDKQVDVLDDEIHEVDIQNKTILAELDKTKGYEQIKKALDQDEETLRNKITVLNKLITGRQDPPKILLGLATGIPKEVWIDSFVSDDSNLKIHGVALNFADVSDFMNNLSDSAFFSDVRLVDSKEIAMEEELHAVDFNLTARRK